jgi:hypothetical protein
MIGPFPGPAVQPASAVVQSPERHPRYFVAMFQELIRNCFLHRSSFSGLSNLPMREMMTNPIFHGNPYILKMRKPAASITTAGFLRNFHLECAHLRLRASLVCVLLTHYEGTPLHLDMRSVLNKIAESLEGDVTIEPSWMSEHVGVLPDDRVQI